MKFVVALTVCLALQGMALAEEWPVDKLDDTGFVEIFDGKTLNGWHVSTETGHSGASGHKTGGRWVVEDGAIIGSQDIPGNGGIIITDKQYGDFEVIVEMNNDFGPDSGLFLRSNEKGQAYQYLIDYHNKGSVAGLYGEGLPKGFHIYNYMFTDGVGKITEYPAPVPLPIKPVDWPRFWQPGKWHTLRARIEGNPPKMTTWIDNVKFMEWQDPNKQHPDKGGIALQVHGGGDFTRQYVRYKGIKVKEL